MLHVLVLRCVNAEERTDGDSVKGIADLDVDDPARASESRRTGSFVFAGNRANEILFRRNYSSHVHYGVSPNVCCWLDLLFSNLTLGSLILNNVDGVVHRV